MEVDSHKGHQTTAREAEEAVKSWQLQLDSLVGLVFPKGIEDEMDIQRNETTGGVNRELHEANEELDAARGRVRASRPLTAQIAIKRQGITKKEGQVAANEQKARDQAEVVASLEKSLEEALEQSGLLPETIRGQKAKLNQ